MHIPPFPLPSNIKTVIHFRVPSVEDGFKFCDLNSHQEEANTTEFLNHMQDKSKGKFNDSAYWTGEDRRTALWWIFISSDIESTSVPFSYQCKVCEEVHFVNVDLTSLMETTTALVKLPKDKIQISIQGKKRKVLVKPLSGAALEHIEILRNNLEELAEGTVEYKIASNELAINELAHCLIFKDQPESEEDAHTFKISELKRMFLKSEFLEAFGLVEQKLRECKHGLLTQYNQGRYFLVAQVPECEKVIEKGGEAFKTLLLPFHSNQFITAL